MLLLFKKIRSSLISSNNFTTYLLYAVGEIILVVIGILIAVTIDGKVKKAQEKEDQIDYYQDIVADLRKDSIVFNDLRKSFERSLLIYYEIYDEIKGRGTVSNERNYDWMLYNRTFAPVTKQNHQMTIDKLKNTDIRSMLNEYFIKQESTQEAIKEFNDIIRLESRPYFFSVDAINSDKVFQEDKYAFLPKGSVLNQDKLKEVLESHRTKQILTYLRISGGYVLSTLKRVIEDNQKLINDLELRISEE